MRYYRAELQTVHKLGSCRAPTCNTERDNTGRAVREILLRKVVVFARFESGIIYPCYLVACLKILGNCHCILAVTLYAQMKRLKSKIKQECILRRLNRAQVTHQLCCSLGDVAAFAEIFGIGHTVVGIIGCGHAGILVCMSHPVEIARVNDYAADCSCVSVHIFGG